MTREEKIRKMLKDYFGASASSISLTTIGCLTDIEVTYEDGPTVSDARRWIDSHVPDVLNITLYRSYSEDVVAAALLTLYDERIDMQESVETMLFSHSFVDDDKDDTYQDA